MADRAARSLAERAASASWLVKDLADRAQHERSCPKAAGQTDEFQCDCWVRSYYRTIVGVLREVGQERPARAPSEPAVNDAPDQPTPDRIGPLSPPS